MVCRRSERGQQTGVVCGGGGGEGAGSKALAEWRGDRMYEVLFSSV